MNFYIQNLQNCILYSRRISLLFFHEVSLVVHPFLLVSFASLHETRSVGQRSLPETTTRKNCEHLISVQFNLRVSFR